MMSKQDGVTTTKAGSSSAGVTTTGGSGGAGGKKDKPKKKRWFGALLDDLEEMGRGIVPGIAAIGKSAGHDVKDLFDGGGHNFQLDDIAKAVGQDYKSRYGMLFHGDFKKFANSVAEHPLAYLLDAASVVTLGGAGVAGAGARAAVTAGRVAHEGSMAAKAAKWAGYVERTEANVAKASKVYGKTSREVRQGEKAGLVRGVREVGGDEFSAPLLRPAKTNPVLRRRDEAVDRVLGAKSLSKVPVIGLQSRVAREDRRSPGLKADTLKRELVTKPASKIRKLQPDQQAAWYLHHEQVSPQDFVGMLKETARNQHLNATDAAVLEKTVERFEKPELIAEYEKPSKQVIAALEATRHLADEDMPELLKSFTNITDRTLTERRLLPQRKIAGATSTTVHPTDLEPTKRALKARQGAEHAELQRTRERATAEGDLSRAQTDRARLASRLKDVADQLLSRIDTAKAARAELRRPEANVPRERVLTRDEALKEKPDAVRHIPGGHTEPTAEEAAAIIARMRRSLQRGPYSAAAKNLQGWLASVYREARYGTDAPDADMLQGERQSVRAARERARPRKHGDVVDHPDLVRAVDKHGAWDTKVAKLAQTAGPNRVRLWSLLKKERAADQRFIDQYPQDSIERALAKAGYNPENRLANPVDDAGVADAVEGWMEEYLEDGVSVHDVAMGAASDRLDMEGARALIEQARRGDHDLPTNPTNEEIADGLAELYMPDDAASIPTQAEFVQRASQSMLQVFEDGVDELDDAGTAFGKIRGDAAKALADRLGIRDADMGVDPSPADWVRAIRAKVEELGFDETYRQDAAALRKAERDFDELGTWAFRDEVFVPDPEQTDFGTVLEFVPELTPELRAKLKSDAKLSPAEHATIRKAARVLQSAARKAEQNSHAEAVLRQRYERLAEPGRRERRLKERAEELQPMPLKGARDANGERYGDSELVNPETGELYRDEDIGLSDAELADQPMGSFFPHRPAGKTRGGGSPIAVGASKRAPGLPSDVTKASTGRRFETGTFSSNPMQLVHAAQRLVRTQHASDLYDAAVARGIPFDRAEWARTGGQKEWVVADKRGITNLNQRLVQLDGVVREMDELLPKEEMANFVEKLGDMSGALAGDGISEADQLVMIPRTYYDRLTADLKQSGAFAKNVIDRPLDVFRSLVLFLRPAYYVNNVVGQNFLLAVRDRGPMFVPEYVRFLATRNLGGARQLFAKAVTDETTGYKLWDAVFAKHGGALEGASAGQVEITDGLGGMTQRMAMSGKRGQRVIAGMLNTPEKANELGAILSDDLPRQFRFIRLMQPHVRAARAAGEQGDDAAIAMRMLDEDPVLAERVTEQTLFDLVDYRGMSNFERKVLRRIVPFYGWLRGITTWTAELGYNHPDQLLELATISEIGQRDNAEWNASVPEWLQGAVRIGGEKDGVQRVINTQGLNPLSTISDVSTLARGAFSEDPSRSLAGGSLAGQLNPYGIALAQAALNKGKSFGTGMPMMTPGQSMNTTARGDELQSRPGWIGAGLLGWAAGTPQAQLVTQFRTQRDNKRLTGNPLSATGVYQSPMSDYLLSYLGLPQRRVNLAAALARRDKDEATVAGEGGYFG